MSSILRKGNKRKHFHQTNEEYPSHYIKHRVAKLKKLQKTMSTLCDDNSTSSEEIRPFYQKSYLAPGDKNLTDDTIMKKSCIDKTEGDTRNRKSINSNDKKRKATGKESDSSDSEEKVGKNRERKETWERKVGMLKLHQMGPSNLNREDADSSSGKEFQKSKITHMKLNSLQKLPQVREDHTISTDSNSGSITQRDKGTAITEAQSLRFKSRIVRILNKFKQVCTEYELRMDRVKWKHFKKDLKYQEIAADIVKKSKDVMENLKTELDAQKTELENFYEEWCKKCNAESTDNDDSSLSELDESKENKDKEKSNKSPSRSTLGSMVSECDSEEIFSDTSLPIPKTNLDETKRKHFSRNKAKPSKPIDTDSENSTIAASPVLGKSKKSRETPSKTNASDQSNASESSLESNDSQNPKRQPIINESLDDIFNDDTVVFPDDVNGKEKTADTHEKEKNLKQKEVGDSNESKDKKSSITEKSNAKLNNEDVNTNARKSTDSKSHLSPKRIESSLAEDSRDSKDDEAEQQAKKAMLESDTESLNDEECVVKKRSRKSLDNSDSEGKQEVKPEKVNFPRKRGKYKPRSNSIVQSCSAKEQDAFSDIEASAKKALLQSNSDDSLSPCDLRKSIDKTNDSDDNGENVHAKEKLLVSSNSESSSSNSSTKIQTLDSSSKKEEEDSSLQLKPICSKRRGRSAKVNYTGLDKKLKMQAKVVLVRLSKSVLDNYGRALDNSRQYLENKEIKSLINLRRLQRDNINANDSRSRSSRKKNKVAKEAQDSLLNHVQEGEVAQCDGKFSKHTGEDCNLENESPSAASAELIVQTNEDLMREADAISKKLLLDSSDSDIGQPKDIENSDSQEEKGETKSKDRSKESNCKSAKKNKVKDMSDNNEHSDQDNLTKEDEEESHKNKWRRNKLLTMNFSSDEDSDAVVAKCELEQKSLREKDEEDGEPSISNNESVKRRRRNRKTILDSESDPQLMESDAKSDNSALSVDKSCSGSDSSIGKKKKIRKRRTAKSSDSDSSLTEKRTKPKRRRIKTIASGSDDSDNSDDMNNSQGTPGKKGRKNIRKVMKDKQVADDTKQAAKEEEERMKRIAERQKLYHEMYEARLAGEEKVDKLVLDFDPDKKEELVIVHENLAKRLKPHQAKGIKFMWDACFESLERTKSSTGSGCIIAHCMGLGKTLQVISLIHTLLAYEETGVKTVMVVCPLSTVLNWLNEFKYWLKDIDDDLEVYELTKMKRNIERKYQLTSWQRTGGVLIIGYEMFRNLTGTNGRMKKSMRESILQCLIDPGPDVIVCDEGHLLKNEDTALSKSIKRVKTLRRIVLTGTPLQNNLIEYHCMVQFVKPNLLGTKKEFLNRFVNPISNGQFDDSTEYDVKLMKKRAYVLHKMLKGCVQRFDYSVLTPFLPPKQEYVIFVRLTEVQISMYRYYLDNLARKSRSAGGSLFADFQALQRIWTHPTVLKLNAEKIDKINEKKSHPSDSEGSLQDFINDDSDSESSSNTTTDENDSDSDDVKSIESNVGRKSTRSNPRNNNPDIDIIPKTEELEKHEDEWWAQFIKPEHFEDMRISAKLLLLFGILRECEQIGDKVLVFSQSLYSLTLIEIFLGKIDNETQNGTASECIDGNTGSWTLGLDYFRLDGQTSAENRNIWCKIFNQPSNTRARLFLISTRAGGLGINLTAANRVIIFDASWNPSHDVQSIFRIYRFGQKKPCYVYRFLAAGTMEEKIYNRQVTKLSLSCRVVDEQQIERHYSNNDLSELYKLECNTSGERPTLNLPKDRLLAEMFLKYKDYVENYHEHDSLLENKAEEELNEEERKQAWLEYEEEKKGKPPVAQVYPAVGNFPTHFMLNQYNMPSGFNISTDYEKLRELLRKDYPNATPETQQMMTTRVLSDMYSYWEQQAYKHVTNHNIVTNQASLRTQVPNFARIPYTMQTTNPVLSNQANTYRATDIRPTEVEDDDVIEVATIPAKKKGTTQEE